MKRTHDHEWHGFSQENFEACFNTIRYKGEFHDHDSDIAKINTADVLECFTLYQSRSEEVTFREDDGNDLPFQAKNTGNWIMEEDDDDILLGNMNLNGDIPFPPGSPSSMMVEPEDPDSISILSNEEISGTTSSEEEPIDVSGIDGKRRRKRQRLLIDPIKEVSDQNIHEQLTSLDDTLGSLELASGRERLKVLKESGGASMLLATPGQSMIHDELKKLFLKGQPSFDIKPGTSVQKEPGSKEEEKFSAEESSMMEESNAQEELNHPQTEKDGIYEFPESFAEDANTLSPEDSDNMKILIDFCRNSDGKQTAAAFYSFLALNKEQAIEGSQNAHEDIVATVGPKFHGM